MLMKIADALSRLVIALDPESEDKPVDCPFDSTQVQNILLQSIGDTVIESPARFSNDFDTYARMTRSTAEVIPRRAHKETEFTTRLDHEGCNCLVCCGRVMAIEEIDKTNFHRSE